MSAKVFFLTTAAILMAGLLLLLVSLHTSPSVLADKPSQRASNQSDASPLRTTGTCIPAYEAPFAFVNQPWDWIEGAVAPDATVDATLKRGGNPIASATTTADSDGWFSLEFRDSDNHVDILAGDEVVIEGGGLDATITVVAIVGGIDVATDSVAGQASNGVFPAQGVASVGLPSDLSFITETVNFDENGRFVVEFGSQVDIRYDHIAKVVYEDPNGNRVGQVFFPEGLDVRVLITEDKVEGTTMPDTTVRVLVSDAEGPKGVATATADETGFYSTFVYDGSRRVDLELGDHVTVSKPGEVREMDLTMYHVSYVQPWNNRVVGTVKGISFPAEGAQGRVDLWSAAEDRWYTKYVGIGPDGSYGADFNGIVEMTDADVIRVWAIASDGTQQALLGWALDFGVSTSDDIVWGYATVSSTAYITLYRGLESQLPTEVIGTATAVADATGYFSTTVMSDGSVADIAPSNAVVVQAGEHIKTLFVGLIDMQADVDNNMLLITAPPNGHVHLEGRRPGVIREDAPYEDDYVWREATIGSNGKTIVGLLPFDVQVGDWFDLTYYGIEEGQAVHRLMAVPTETISLAVYLPLVTRNAE